MRQATPRNFGRLCRSLPGSGLGSARNRRSAGKSFVDCKDDVVTPMPNCFTRAANLVPASAYVLGKRGRSPATSVSGRRGRRCSRQKRIWERLPNRQRRAPSARRKSARSLLERPTYTGSGDAMRPVSASASFRRHLRRSVVVNGDPACLANCVVFEAVVLPRHFSHGGRLSLHVNMFSCSGHWRDTRLFDRLRTDSSPNRQLSFRLDSSGSRQAPFHEWRSGRATRCGPSNASSARHSLLSQRSRHRQLRIRPRRAWAS